jgi:hypothetical protein
MSAPRCRVLLTTTKGKKMTFTNEELALIAAALEFYGGMTDDEVTMQQAIVSRIQEMEI